MTIERALGLVLRTRPLTETSLIVHWITLEHGRVATVAKGARRPKSPFRGKLDLFYVAEFSFQRSRRSDLHTLREVSLRGTHPHLREDYARLRQASYGALLVEQITETQTPLPGTYALLAELADCLDADAARPQYILAFELKLLAEAGQGPDLTAQRLSPETRALAAQLMTAGLRAVGRLEPPARALAELRHFLERFLVYHLDRVPRGRTEAIEANAPAGNSATALRPLQG
jgi:DNA repair protein RecO (recombination protein O)